MGRGFMLIMVLIEVVVLKGGKVWGEGKRQWLWGWGCPHYRPP